MQLSECVENVHGIRETYLKEGKRSGRMFTAAVKGSEERKAYFIGKLLWAKGFNQLLELQSSFRERTGEYFDIDIYGSRIIVIFRNVQLLGQTPHPGASDRH